MDGQRLARRIAAGAAVAALSVGCTPVEGQAVAQGPKKLGTPGTSEVVPQPTQAPKTAEKQPAATTDVTCDTIGGTQDIPVDRDPKRESGYIPADPEHPSVFVAKGRKFTWKRRGVANEPWHVENPAGDRQTSVVVASSVPLDTKMDQPYWVRACEPDAAAGDAEKISRVQDVQDTTPPSKKVEEITVPASGDTYQERVFGENDDPYHSKDVPTKELPFKN